MVGNRGLAGKLKCGWRSVPRGEERSLYPATRPPALGFAHQHHARALLGGRRGLLGPGDVFLGLTAGEAQHREVSLRHESSRSF